MDTLSRAELRTLLDAHESPCVSLYMPMHKTMPDAQQNPVRYKNLLNEAERRLGEKKSGKKMNGMLKEAKALLDQSDLWMHPAAGLAAFISPEEFRHYRLPLEFGEMLVVTNRFHTKPLLPLFTGDGRYYVLAVSQNEARVLACDRYHCEEIEIPQMPHSRDALNDVFEKQRQLHTIGHTASGEGIGIHHGHGADERLYKDTILRYFREIDRRLSDVIKSERAPLVLAAVDYLHPIYKEANTYPHLFERGVTGNPELWNETELHAQIWAVVEPHFRQAQTEALARYQELKGMPLASQNFRHIIPAAYYGRVDTLFVPVGVQKWGTFDSVNDIVKLHDEQETGDVDLLDAAATQTILNSGMVYPLAPGEMPDGASLAAIFRY